MKTLDEWERELGQSSGLTVQQLKNMTQHLSDLAAKNDDVALARTSRRSKSDPAWGSWGGMVIWAWESKIW